MKTVLILAYECHLFNRKSSTIGAQRPYQFAKYLPGFGWKAIVLCSNIKARYTLDPHSAWKPVVKKIVLEALSSNNDQNSLIIPLPSFVFADVIDNLWLSAVTTNVKNGAFAPKEGGLNTFRRKVCSLLKIFRGDHSQSWQKVALYAFEVILEQGINVDAQLACHGPDASLFVAKTIYQKNRIPWLVDFRDPALIGKGRISAFLSKIVLVRLMHTSSGIINVNPYWVQLDKEMFKKDTFCIPNGFDEEEFRMPLQTLRSNSDQLLLFYFGGVKPGQSFKLLFEALQKIKLEYPNRFRNINFKYYGPGKEKVIKEKNRYCPSLKYSIEGSISRENVLKKASKADVLILLTKKGKDLYFKNGFYPGKVFEYFGLNKPILAIPADRGLIDNLLKETNTGISVNSAEEIVEYLTSFLVHDTQEAARPLKNQRVVDQYSRKVLTKKLSIALAKLHIEEIRSTKNSQDNI